MTFAQYDPEGFFDEIERQLSNLME